MAEAELDGMFDRLLGIADDGSDCDDGDPLPDIVLEAMERRARAKRGAAPASDGSGAAEVVDALRRHFSSGRADRRHGGFVDCMERIGATPRSADPLVYEYDGSFFGAPATEEDHEARVRLLRYDECVAHQAARGCKPGDDWVMTRDDDVAYAGSDSCGSEGGDLTPEQLKAFGMTFTMGFYYYTNIDNVMNGLGCGTKSGSDVTTSFPVGFPRDMKMCQIEVGMRSMLGQCEELAQRYEDLQRPLGPKGVLRPDVSSAAQQPKRAKKKKGKKNRGGKKNEPQTASRAWGTHSEEIASRLQALLAALDKYFLVSEATADFMTSFADMLVLALQYDPDVANAIVDEKGESGSLVIKLQARALAHAKTSGKRKWWEVYESLTNVLGYVVHSLLGGGERTAFSKLEELDADEGSPAAVFFFEKVVPVLLPSIRSSFAQERVPALQNFERASFCAPHSAVLRLVGSRETWSIIDGAVRAGLEECQLKTNEAKVASWNDFMKHCSLGSAAVLLTGLCKHALSTEEVSATARHYTPITPTALAIKMVKRGVVPLLMEIATADLGHPSAKAMEGLGAISRVKDCRTIILQDTGGMDMISAALSSKDGSLVSGTLLLVLHLLWDEEWWLPFSSIEPQLEVVAIRWGLFAMRRIVNRANETRKKHREMFNRWQALMVEVFRMDGGEEKERKQQTLNELKAKMEGQADENWLTLETDENRTTTDFLLGRCLFVLQSVCKLTNGSERLVRAGGLSFFAACLDVPISDSKIAACGGLHNTIMNVGMERVTPDLFLDPSHLVRSAVMGLHRTVMAGGTLTQQLQIFMRVVLMLKEAKQWKPYFDSLPPMHRTIVEAGVARIGFAPSRGNEVPGAPKVDTVNEKCAQYTGKLRSCAACGKLETKRGEMSHCSRCLRVAYCSKECQKEHWHKGHKAECKKMRGK